MLQLSLILTSLAILNFLFRAYPSRHRGHRPRHSWGWSFRHYFFKDVGPIVLALVVGAMFAEAVGCASDSGASSSGTSGSGGTADRPTRNTNVPPCGSAPACDLAQPCASSTTCPERTYCGTCADGSNRGFCASACIPQGEAGAPCTSNEACRSDLGLACLNGVCAA